MATCPPHAVGEWYHCYTRGVDKRVVFKNEADYDRFLVHLYVANREKNVRVSDISDTRLQSVLSDNRFQIEDQLVEIGAYALMPTHAHFILRQSKEGSLATFMQKVFTGYTMYFNNKNQRTGALFSGTYKSKHVGSDDYLKLLLPYVLMNPIELFEPNWKIGSGDLTAVEQRLLEYQYSNLQDLYGIPRQQNKITSNALLQYYDDFPTLSEMLSSAQEFYSKSLPQTPQV